MDRVGVSCGCGAVERLGVFPGQVLLRSSSCAYTAYLIRPLVLLLLLLLQLFPYTHLLTAFFTVLHLPRLLLRRPLQATEAAPEGQNNCPKRSGRITSDRKTRRNLLAKCTWGRTGSGTLRPPSRLVLGAFDQARNTRWRESRSGWWRSGRHGRATRPRLSPAIPRAWGQTSNSSSPLLAAHLSQSHQPRKTDHLNSNHKYSKMRSNHTTPYNTTPRSPLAHTMRSSTTPHPAPSSSGSSRRANGPDLRLPSLPGQFHPLFYESQNSSKANSPFASRPSSSRGSLSPQFQAHKQAANQREVQQMQQYHRDVLARAASTLVTPAPPSTDTPRAPHLAPHGSPTDPATPLTLEEPKDYMTARGIGEGSSRAVADKYIREEQERRNGMHADRSSPAVSPRC